MQQTNDNSPTADSKSKLLQSRKASIALFAAGFATFSSVYCVQPLLPMFSEHFAVTPAVSSLSLSLVTGALACSILVAGVMSESLERKRIMGLCLLLSTVLSVLTAFAPSWELLLVARTLSGVVLGGVPALALAYLAEETPPSTLGYATGLYIGGNALGGMSGRVLSGFMSDIGGWQLAFGAEAAIGAVATIAFFRLLPPSSNFRPRRGLSLGQYVAPIMGHLRHPALHWVFVSAFALMGAFVTVYNYLGYRLSAPPFLLDQSAIGAVFGVYLLGTISSTVAGRMADRHGRAPVLAWGLVVMTLGLALTLFATLWVIIGGIALLTCGFFAAHSTASGWTGQLAEHGKGQAAGLYLLAYYLGSSIIGSLGGVFWAYGRWPGVMLLVGCMMVLAYVASARLWQWQLRDSICRN